MLPAIRMPIGAFVQGLDWSPVGFMRYIAIKQSGGRSTSVTNAIFNKNGVRKNWSVPAGGVTEERAIDMRTKAAIGSAMMVGMCWQRLSLFLAKAPLPAAHQLVWDKGYLRQR